MGGQDGKRGGSEIGWEIRGEFLEVGFLLIWGMEKMG